MVEYGATGVVWGQENFVAYVQDPTDFLREVLDNRRARGKMAFQVRDEEDAVNIYAYLAQFATPAE
jgi:cytochrome c